MKVRLERMVRVVLGTMTMADHYRSFVSHEADAGEHERMIRLYADTWRVHHGRPIIDTARYYRNEAYLCSIVKRIPYTISWASKANPWAENDFSSGRFGGYGRLGEQISESVRSCGIGSFDTYFLHAPDPDTPVGDVVDEMGTAFRRGVFERWGLSNFSLEQCREIMEVCERRGVPGPSVYQGMHNVFCRRVEEMMPFVRENGMSFWAYNPLMGGLVCRPPDTNSGRFANPIYQSLFMRPSLLEACTLLTRSHDGARLALSWLRDESLLTPDDCVILGASSLRQLRCNLDIWVDAAPLKAEEREVIHKAYSVIRPEDTPDYWY